MNPTIALPVDLVNNILGYLGTRPYQEVYQLIGGIQASAQQPVAPAAPADVAPAPVEAPVAEIAPEAAPADNLADPSAPAQ